MSESKVDFVRRIATGLIPAALGLATLLGVAAIGERFDWRMPKFSALIGRESATADDWCAEHGVPESQCVECNADLLPKGRAFGWCRTHGVHECPHCNPEVAQLADSTSAAAERSCIEEVLAFAPRPANGSKCRQHQRRLQFASDDVFRQLDIATTPAIRGEVSESINATGELELDPTKVARLSARVNGTVWRLLKRVGERVRAGEIVALVDAADVGKAKGELLQALGAQLLREQTLARLRDLAGKAVTAQNVLDAEAAVAESVVRVAAARQTLANLGFTIDPKELQALAPADAARRLRLLGLPDALATTLGVRTESNNLLPIRSPFDGEVIERASADGEAAGPDRPLLVVADTRRMWLTLHVRGEEAERIKPGLSVRFRHDGHDVGDTGTVAWISPAADEKTRTVPVRVAWPNENGQHQARTFGTAEIILRQASDAIVVPASAIHWEGCCHVVFVRDKDFDSSPYKVFHVRKVRPGAILGTTTEIAAGLLPGEVVATANSGILRSELLKNDLGAG